MDPLKLMTISDLQHSGFGQPWPRHGLKLLYWFANECIWVTDDGDMRLSCDMEKGYYGFHKFENRWMGQNQKLLPDINFPYFLLGNLNYPGAEMLPDYVKKDNNGIQNCNTDRIIVSYHGEKKFGEIYLTSHKGRNSFDPEATFPISRSLLEIIQSFPSLDQFLQSFQQPAFMMVNSAICSDSKSDSYSETEVCNVDTGATRHVAKSPCQNCCIIL